ncbi:MAG: UDP-N-acetylmuramoylalanine--D-glutamate ligase [Bacteroidetes bacterium GWF2_42_66]|nr:MAG: UDP-N-acetylmuramoylalanine--D-glutamate ligase [Bacteroidetes bacterium GWA2_42_15]OFY00169.1 MAG: UDP-N-acetylmuramoylalanine--D-glutamate ligase [Bacteroidetes bacterium GWE2_42_39]OFY40311.1 MAG: UDP-N-acetylmuramoylalanine--D-glutamate ligase [Bacteroidetes bacterium GWF2_42_66]HBL73704.1 UDP-N-acetylmuramoyl-L-alanine--D-glutamate ligase [Prolixibacteraceae bacterium]HCR90714.1 UDP-N-acetylmuramoyl-L-alanine--D-glutamate ligase [Prolixibacteraceae bacterium]
MPQKIVILGAGESGTGAAILAKKQGNDVFVSDLSAISEKYRQVLQDYKIAFEEGKHTEELILNAAFVVKSPGIPEKAPIIKKMKEKHIPVLSEIEYAGKFTSAKMICITGSNGKTTTTMLTYHLLQKAGFNVGLAGNVGRSLAWQVAEENFDYYVIELSSFQLDNMYDFKADIAVLLNITPDHLDRYDYQMQNYVDSKFRILQNQTEKDVFIYCADDPVILSELKKIKITACKAAFSLGEPRENGAGLEQNNMIINWEQNTFSMSILDISLQGKHNTYNSMAAGLAGMVLQIRNENIRESLAEFKGVEHRLERFLKVHGIDFINDSKATNVNSTWYALESMTKKTVWIVGGIDKGNNYDELLDLARSKVKAIVCLGKDNAKIIKAFKEVVPDIVETRSMVDAVRSAYYLAKDGDAVLLSPACASFDLFENYEDRGRQFKTAVRDL